MNYDRERIFNIEAICNERCSLPNLAQLLDEEGRPQVIRRAAPQASYIDEGRTYVYVIYALRKCHRVLALACGTETDNMSTTVSTMQRPINRIYAIPQSYQGWFSISSEANQTTMPIEMKTIEEVFASKATQFMTCDTLSAYQLLKTTTTRTRIFGSDPDPQLHPAEISIGLVLTVGAVLVDTRDNDTSGFCCCSRSNAVNSSDCPGATKTEVLYLQCFDVGGRHLLLPIYTRGRFYAVAYNDGEDVGNDVQGLSSRCVHQIKDILRDNCLPLQVSLVHGKVPVGQTALFIGCRLKLLSRREEKSLVACQVGSGLKPAFVEFPSDCGVLFQTTAVWNTIKSEKVVVDALRFCSKNIEAYKTEIQPVINGDKAIEEWITFSDTSESVVPVEQRRKSILLETPEIIPTILCRTSHVDINEQIKQQQLLRNEYMLISAEQPDIEEAPESLYGNLKEVALSRINTVSSLICATEIPTEQELLSSIDFTNRKLLNLNVSSQHINESFRELILNDTSSDSLAYDNEGYLVPLEERPDRISKMIPDEYSINSSESMKSVQISRLGESLENYLETITPDTDIKTITPNTSIKNITPDTDPKNITPNTDINNIASNTDMKHDDRILLETITKDSGRKIPFARMRAVTLRNGYDRKQLDLFLEDSVFELHRNRQAELQRVDTIGCARGFERAKDSNATMQRARRASEPWSKTLLSTIPQLEFPLTREQVDVYLEKLFNIEGVYDDGENSESGLGTSRRSICHDSTDWVLSPSNEMNEMPCGDLVTWSVEEVTMALRYIGMNGIIITKFCKEQIDGKLLADINNELLVEGFPELNAWNRQKLVKFVHGWRPKRTTPTSQIAIIS